MITRLWDMLTGDAAPSPAAKGRHDTHELHVAAAALLIEVAAVDGSFEAEERSRIRDYARHRLGLDATDAQTLMDVAERQAADATQLHRFTQLVKNGLSYEERVQLIETLWEVVYADGNPDAYELQLMRRIAGLVYVTDRDSGLARKRVLAERGKRPARPRGTGE